MIAEWEDLRCAVINQLHSWPTARQQPGGSDYKDSIQPIRNYRAFVNHRLSECWTRLWAKRFDREIPASLFLNNSMPARRFDRRRRLPVAEELPRDCERTRKS
jgi:hypothetical protein